MPAIPVASPVLTVGADRAAALSWDGYAPGGGELRAQHVAFRAPNGTWSTPAPVFPPLTWEPTLASSNRGSAALPGGGLAMAYASERSGKTTCSFVRVTP